jgi:hypothetical protein
MVAQRAIDRQVRVDLHPADHLVHVPEIVHHVPEIVHHVPEIVHHVPEIAQNNAQVVAVVMIALVQLAMFQMVAQSATHVDSAQLQWSAIRRAYVHESSNQIFLSM